MSKSWRRPVDRRFSDDYEAYSKSEIEYRAHKKEKRIQAALHSKNLSALVEEEEDDYDDYD